MVHEAPYLTPKAIAKRLKAKGLGKQWLYCQMCRKQCRDQNGFKCHCESEGHIRNMELFAEKGEELIAEYSKKFEDKFMEYMRRSYRSTCVSANVVYNQIIRERNHVRMNGTRWATLSEFVEHLAKTGKVKVEETDKGPHLRYVEDPSHSETQFKKGLKRKRANEVASEGERHERELQLQRERCLMEARKQEEKQEKEEENSEDSLEKEGSEGEETEVPGDENPSQSLPPQGEVKVAFSIPKKKSTGLPPLPPSASAFAKLSKTSPDDAGSSKVEASWLCKDIVVKVVSKKLKSYGKKGVVKRVIDNRCGEIEMLDSGEVVRVDEKDLETVIPQIGRTVRVVNGSYKGCDAKLVSCDIDKYSVSIEITSRGSSEGKIVSSVPYEDVCKLV